MRLEFLIAGSWSAVGRQGSVIDMVRSGKLTPASIRVRVRVLVPDTGRPWTLPCRIDDLDDEPAFRARAANIAGRSLSAILDSVTELHDLGVIPEVTAAVRVHGLAPLFKLYLINNREAFFGFYPITEHLVKTAGATHAIYDLMGKDSLLFHHTDDGQPDSAGAQYLAQARTWFDSVWASVATDYSRD